MPLSYQNYTGDNVTTTFNIPFTYTATSEISVTVDGVAQTGLTFPSASEVQLTSAPASGTVVQVRRTTDLTSRAVDFASGSVLTEEDLDNANIQIFHSSQEAVDLTDDTIQEDVDSKWDAENKVIKNVANPVSAQDAATKDYLENTWLTAADKAQLNSLNIPNLNTVATNIADVNAVAADATDIGTVSTNIASVNTVATNIADVVTVANDLNEAISEIETAADDLNEAVSDIDTVSTNIANVNTVGGAISNVNTVATNIGNVNTVGGNITNVNTVAGISGNVTTVAGISANVGTVAGISGNVTTVAGISGDVSTVSGNNSNVTIVATDIANVNSVAGNEANINSVAGNSTNINTVATNNTNVSTVATNIANVNTVGGSIANVNTVATNISGVNDFADRYRVASSAPTTSLDVGDLYFDTTSDTMKVYGSSGWQNAGSSVNGTSQRYHYDITGTPTSVTGVDANGNTLAYDAGYADVYVNGVRMSDADITITSGDTVTFTEALSNGDEVDIVAYGTFSVASLNADNLDSGTVPSARVSGAYTGITSVGTLTSFASTGIDDNASSTAVTINASGKVGLGIDPSTLPSFISHAMKIANGGGLSITSPSSSDNRYIFFGTGTSSSDVQLAAIKNSSSDLMFLGASGSEKMRIDSSGNLLVGTTDTNPGNDSTASAGLSYNVGFGGQLILRATANSSLMLNRTTSDGDIISFRKNGTDVGMIGTFGSALYMASPDGTDAGLRVGNSTVVPVTTTGALRDNAIDLGSVSARWNNLYLSGGVFLGGTGSANLLDDYEEGSWTVDVQDSSGNSATSIDGNGRYIKVGNLVTVTGRFSDPDLTGLTASNDLRIYGLPFAMSAFGGSSLFYNGAAPRMENVSWDGTNSTQISTQIGEGATYVRFVESRNGTTDDFLTVSQFNSTSDCWFSITYSTTTF